MLASSRYCFLLYCQGQSCSRDSSTIVAWSYGISKFGVGFSTMAIKKGDAC
jgi:hypothetical protein